MDIGAFKKVVVVLLSGGIDSTVAATMKAREPDTVVFLLSIAYGQGAQDAERLHARRVANWLLEEFENVVEHFELCLSGTSRNSKTADAYRCQDHNAVASARAGLLGWRSPSRGWPQEGYPSTRDEAFALIAAAGVEARMCDLPFAEEGEIVIGTNKDDLSNFSDIYESNYDTHLNSIISTKLVPQGGRPIKVSLPLIALTKPQVLRLGLDLGAPLQLTWSCYTGSFSHPCGDCDQCTWRTEAFRELGIIDTAKAKELA